MIYPKFKAVVNTKMKMDNQHHAFMVKCEFDTVQANNSVILILCIIGASLVSVVLAMLVKRVAAPVTYFWCKHA